MGEDEGQRWCKKHEAYHPLSQFYRVQDSRYSGGYRYRCKVVSKKMSADSAKAAPEGSRLREAQRRAKRNWAQQHPENARKNSANYRARKAASQVEQAGEAGQGDQPEQPD